ncbi:hypothetical protein EV175_001476, partial [Coemansia sp. RSA 1933]
MIVSILLLSFIPYVHGDTEDTEPLSSVAQPDYVNNGSQYDIKIAKISTHDNPEDILESLEHEPNVNEEAHLVNVLNSNSEAAEAQDDNPGFNLDNILDLMAGDESGNVDFGAIGIELASNLVNVVDMNELGNFATTFGLMMSGLGTAAEIQRQRGGTSEQGTQQNGGIPNVAINSGLSALIGQVLSAQQANSGGFNANSGNQGINLDGMDMAKLLETVMAGSGGGSGDSGMQHIADVVDSILGEDTSYKASTASGKERASMNVGSGPGSPENIIGSATGKSVPRNAASAFNDFINGNDTSNISDIAQAIGIRNFFKTEEKTIPD